MPHLFNLVRQSLLVSILAHDAMVATAIVMLALGLIRILHLG